MLVRIIDSGLNDPFLNMAIDEAISIFVRNGNSPPTLRFYGWIKPAVTIGEFQKATEINQDICNKLKIPVVRRPTGGKGILHYDDLTYSFTAKKEGIFRGSLFQTYEKLSSIFSEAFNLSGIKTEIKKNRDSVNRSSLCFARSSFGEISFNGIKIMGSAQKRWRDGFLQQGTIPIIVNRELLKKVFLCMPEEAENIYGLKEIYDKLVLSASPQEIASQLALSATPQEKASLFEASVFKEKFKENIKLCLRMAGFEIVEEAILEEEFALAQELLQKYQNPQ